MTGSGDSTGPPSTGYSRPPPPLGEVLRGQSSPETTAPLSDREPLSVNFDSEDFLFHIYRGSELLADNCVSEAKDELEQALKMQPSDPEGQGLLGIVYFRLGMYPQALRIYAELMRAFPDEVTPRVNAALCYLKTGQPDQTRGLLEAVVTRVPEHKRAWAYLGLAFERLGDPEKAKVAYERAGQPGRARRLEAAASDKPGSDRGVEPSDHVELREAAADAVRELDDHPTPFVRASEPAAPKRKPGAWRAVELGRVGSAGQRARVAPSRPSGPVPMVPGGSVPPEASSPLPAAPALPNFGHSGLPERLEEAVRGGMLQLPEAGVRWESERVVVVTVTDWVAVRARAVQAMLPGSTEFRTEPLRRRLRGRDLDDLLGGLAAPMCRIEGSGHAVLAGEPHRTVTEFELAGDLLYVRESRLLAFDAGVQHQNGRLARADGDPTPIVQLAGRGWVLIETAFPLRSVQVGAEPGRAVDADRVLGWTGRLLPRATPAAAAPGGSRSFVTFTGDGTLLIELPA